MANTSLPDVQEKSKSREEESKKDGGSELRFLFDETGQPDGGNGEGGVLEDEEETLEISGEASALRQGC